MYSQQAKLFFASSTAACSQRHVSIEKGRARMCTNQPGVAKLTWLEHFPSFRGILPHKRPQLGEWGCSGKTWNESIKRKYTIIKESAFFPTADCLWKVGEGALEDMHSVHQITQCHRHPKPSFCRAMLLGTKQQVCHILSGQRKHITPNTWPNTTTKQKLDHCFWWCNMLETVFLTFLTTEHVGKKVFSPSRIAISIAKHANCDVQHRPRNSLKNTISRNIIFCNVVCSFSLASAPE